MAGRKDIAKDGKKTQFKKGNTKSKGHAGKWLFREQLDWIKGQDIDPNDIDGSFKKLMGIKALVAGQHPKAEKINITRLFAIRYMERSIKKCDPILFEKIIDQTEGKLAETHIIKADKPIPMDGLTPENASKAYNETSGKK
jgi:hypothetical protein